MATVLHNEWGKSESMASFRYDRIYSTDFLALLWGGRARSLTDCYRHRWM